MSCSWYTVLGTVLAFLLLGGSAHAQAPSPGETNRLPATSAAIDPRTAALSEELARTDARLFQLYRYPARSRTVPLLVMGGGTLLAAGGLYGALSSPAVDGPALGGLTLGAGLIVASVGTWLYLARQRQHERDQLALPELALRRAKLRSALDTQLRTSDSGGSGMDSVRERDDLVAELSVVENRLSVLLRERKQIGGVFWPTTMLIVGSAGLLLSAMGIPFIFASGTPDAKMWALPATFVVGFGSVAIGGLYWGRSRRVRRAVHAAELNTLNRRKSELLREPRLTIGGGKVGLFAHF